MNPPFGTRATRQGERAGRSETILTQRALAFVSGAGRLCTLIPSGMLFGGGMEKQLRIQFVDDYSLNAIISLPKVAFQPYSGLQTHLLLVTKSEPQDSASTWFLRAERDGYTSGRGRDLTKDTDAKTSDFPLIEMLLAWDGVWSNTSDQLPLRYQRLTVGQDSALVVGGSAPGVVTRIERYDAGSQHILLINSLYNAQTVTQIINVSEGKLELLAADREATLKAKLSLEKKEVLPPAVLLLREEDQGISVVVASDGRLIGTRLLCENLRQADYDLRVERYVRAEEIRAAARPPAELLADIRANQRGFTRRIDSLLGRLEAPRISDDKLIAPVWLPPIGLPMIELLNNDQRTIWNIVVSLTLQVTQNTSIQNSQQEIYEVPDYFTIETLIENGIDMPEAEIEKAIDLFVQMGLVVFANLPGSAERRLVVYRLVSERDIWKPRSTTNAEVTP